jgi:hypothetical protein
MQADPGQEREALLEEALRWALTAIENMAGEAKEWPAFDKARAALAAREEPPDARVTVGQSRIGPVGAAVNRRRKRCRTGDPTPKGPVNDLVEHDTDGGDCVCGPETQPVQRDGGGIAYVIVHHSLDGREQAEQEPKQ